MAFSASPVGRAPSCPPNLIPATIFAAHGDSFITLRYKNRTWQLTRGVNEWRTYIETSLRFALSLMTLLYFTANVGLKLPYVAEAHELANLMKENDLFG